MNVALGWVVVASLACGGGDPPPAVPHPAPAPVVAAPVAAPPIEPAPVAAPPGPIWATPEPDVTSVIIDCDLGAADGTFRGGESETMDFEYNYAGTWKLEGDTLSFSGRKTGYRMEEVADAVETKRAIDEPYERVLTGVTAYRRGQDSFLRWTVPEGVKRAGGQASWWCRKNEGNPYAVGWYDSVSEVHHVVLYNASGSREPFDAAARAITDLECPYDCFATIDGGEVPQVSGVRVTEGNTEVMDALRARFGGIEEAPMDRPEPIVVVVGSPAHP